MADLTADRESHASHVEVTGTEARSLETSITGPLLFAVSAAIAALFAVETCLGMLWALSAEFRSYASWLR